VNTTVVIFEAVVVRITSTVVIVIALPVVVADATVLATVGILSTVFEAVSETDSNTVDVDSSLIATDSVKGRCATLGVCVDS
jgi:hypothetical protein